MTKEIIETTHAYYADWEIFEPNVLETVIEIPEPDLEVIVINALVWFPTPRLAGITVTAHDGLKDTILIKDDVGENDYIRAARGMI